MLKKLYQAFLNNKLFVILIVTGSVTWSLTMVKSGLVYNYGMGFWGPNGHDGIWHVALANSLAKGSWEMPLFSGELIKNYHIGFDLLLAVLHKITAIPVINLYFQVIPPILAILVGIAAYKFTLEWTASKSASIWATFFTYFGGSLGWMMTLIQNREIGGESVFWSQQAISTLINPPYALSLVILLSGLTFLLKGRKKNDDKYLVLSTFLLGALIQIKVYAGLLVLFGLIVGGFYDFIKNRSRVVIKVFVGALIISVLLFDFNQASGSVILFKPLWFLESLFASPDRFYWPKFAEALMNYRLGNVWIKGSMAYVVAFLIFLVGNFGSRILFIFWGIKKAIKFKGVNFMDLLVAAIVIAGLLIPTFFVQSGNPWNTIQFVYYSQLFAGILAGVWFAGFIDRVANGFKKTLLITTLVLVTLPTTTGTLLYNYLPGRPPAMISNGELEALSFLYGQPDGVVLTQQYNKKSPNNIVPPKPLYLYESTAYVSALTGKKSYIEDQVNLEITGYEWQKRALEADLFFNDTSFDGKHELLDKKNIDYVYVVNSLQNNGKNLYLEPNLIYKNSEVSIYKID